MLHNVCQRKLQKQVIPTCTEGHRAIRDKITPTHWSPDDAITTWKWMLDMFTLLVFVIALIQPSFVVLLFFPFGMEMFAGQHYLSNHYSFYSGSQLKDYVQT